MTHRLIFGCGYLGERVAKLWLDSGDEVTVATRSVAHADDFKQRGYQAIVADVTDASTLANLPSSDTVLFAVGYDRSAGPSIHEVYAQGVRNVLANLPEGAGRFIYISTTGVWSSGTGGGADGDWVDEQTPTNPQRDGGKASLAAEEAVLTAADRFAGGATVLRLAGIYGPGRVPFLDKLRAGEPIPAPSTGSLNLIHVDDAAAVTVAVSDYPGACEPVLCVSDGKPPARGDYYREVARLLGAGEPRFTAPEAGSPRAARAASSKRVRSGLMRETLGVPLKYPDYRAGLAAILGSESTGG